MNDLKISDDLIRELLPNENPEQLKEVFSYITWSVLCEPGDGLAGMLVQKLGAAKALANELDAIPANQVRAQLESSGATANQIDKHGSFEKALVLGRERWRPRMNFLLVRKALSELQRLNGFIITPVSADWPSQLWDLEFHAPMSLWVRGHRQAISQLDNSLGVVGCRGSSSYGDRATEEMVSALIEKDVSIISGGAYGIDGVAHRTALALKGNTVAVMAGGVDRLYPTGNSDLLNRVIQTGAVISELPPGAFPTRWRFLQRNRLIAALAQATLVVEANWRSGSLNTVSHAERINREVFAVPGPITSPKSAGTNKLIADRRAELVLDGKDLLERLGKLSADTSLVELPGLGALETRVLDALGFDSLEIAEICSSAGLTRDEARLGISSLELDGLIMRRGSAWSRSQTTV